MAMSDDATRLDPRQLGDAAALCARSFRDAPHIAHFFPENEGRHRNAAALFAMRIRYGLRYGEVHVSDPLEGIAVWIPSEHAAPSIWRQLRSGGTRLMRCVGREAVNRMNVVAAHNDALRRDLLPEKHWMLAVLAVDPSHQRRGIATGLLRPMLQRLDSERLPGYLELTEEGLIPFYERVGFAPASPSCVPNTELTVWPLVRSP
jgi:GNAT superfamily N-acetyltransferase